MTSRPPPQRVEHQLTDKGYVPVYTTAVVEQPWASYSATDHEVWATLFARQQQVLVGPRERRVPAPAARDGHDPDRIPKFDDLNRVLRKTTGLGAGRRRGPAARTHLLRPSSPTAASR
jgi:phenylalanine-4-hydroxylase